MLSLQNPKVDNLRHQLETVYQNATAGTRDSRVPRPLTHRYHLAHMLIDAIEELTNHLNDSGPEETFYRVRSIEVLENLTITQLHAISQLSEYRKGDDA